VTRRLLAAALVLAGVTHLAMSLAEEAPEPTVIRIGTCRLQVEIANTPTRRSAGLSDRVTLRDDGLLLQWDRPGLHAIWMRDMRIPLDLAWIDEANVVRAVLADVPPCIGESCPIYAPPGAAASVAVLETSAGRLAACGVRAGDRVVLDAPDTERQP